MLVIKYTKQGCAKFISHLDFLRHFSRTLRRQGVVLEISKGFNPHEIMYFAPPSSTGLSSAAEYCVITSNENADGFKERFNDVSIEGVTALWIKQIDKNPNLASKATFAEYEIPCGDNLENLIAEAFKKDVFEVSFDKKGELVTKEVRNLMHSFEIVKGKIKVILAVGENTLRMDRFLNALGCNTISKVKKTRLFFGSGDALEDIDNLFV